MTSKPATVLVVALLLLTAAAPSALAATGTSNLAVDVTQDTAGATTVTVLNNGTAVENAAVNVTADGSYGGTGDYTTDADGEVALPEPSAAVNVTVEATSGNDTATTTVQIAPIEEFETSISQNEDGSATVTVTRNDTAVENASVNVTADGAYTGTGNYTTDADGEVALDEPNSTVNVTVEATEGTDSATATAELSPIAEFTASLSQNADGTATVTVLRDNSPVENASVNVTADGSYAGTGNYTTDADGEVPLPEPSTAVNVTVEATEGNDTATTTANLTPVDNLAVNVTQNADGTATVTVTDGDTAVENATVNVTSDDDYLETGTYTTDANGTVSLPAPTSNVTITVTATYEGEEATTTANLTIESVKNFGQLVKRFVHNLKAAGFSGPLGRHVSEFATQNNPSNEKANGPPAHAAANDDDEESSQGNETADASANDAPGNSGNAPGHQKADEAGNDDDDGANGQAKGHEKDDEKNPNRATSTDDSTDDEPSSADSTDDDEEDDDGNEGNGNGGGPPDHANK